MSEKFTLLALGNHCADDGSNAFPSVATIALHSGLSERTVKRALQALLDRGIIEVQAKATNRRPTTYAITFRGDTMTPQEGLGVTNRHARGDNGTPLGVTQCHPNHNEPFIEPATAISKKVSRKPDNLREMLNPIFRDRAIAP
jgi:DNA-binding transcriptional MocR family regulator